VNGLASTDCEVSLPSTNWLALPILDKHDRVIAERIARACLDKDVAYVCTLGSACEMLHDCFDETIVTDKFLAGQPMSSPDDFEHSPMTTWHNAFDEGVWFALTAAYDDYNEIRDVVCINMTESAMEDHLKWLVEAINDGWLPLDDE
jgi:hypothetical protein